MCDARPDQVRLSTGKRLIVILEKAQLETAKVIKNLIFS